MPEAMNPEAIAKAAVADRDVQPLTEADLKRMKRTPQTKIRPYVGSLGNWTTTTPDHQAGTAINPNAQKREATSKKRGAQLTHLFSNQDRFSHKK